MRENWNPIATRKGRKELRRFKGTIQEMLTSTADIHILKLLHNPYFHLCSLFLSELHSGYPLLVTNVRATKAMLLAPSFDEEGKKKKKINARTSDCSKSNKTQPNGVNKIKSGDSIE